ncbi:RHS repeat-associated core domain-containing protein [Amycolatopsis sp. GM8]|uniref:RHS repeat-associated core domain-containing protein n=1 Tax=Amycolatopsis sp. GM8 TaxID=2896530 RepID=UPI001F3CE92B|nr:RHS repeat-associated core domain-containing protein [Amycolatopsis sp. GM8]
MADGNPLVAQAQSQTTAVTGIGIAESASDLANGVKDGSWVEFGMGALGVGMEALSMVMDPIGTLAQYGASWLIEHVQPLKEALDWLAGNPPVIQSYADTWGNVAKEVNAVAGDLANEAKTGTAGWTGGGGDAYRQHVAEQTDAIAGASTLADGISTGVMVMGQVVAMVRETVRDLVAELVGKLISWVLEEACTLGFATPLVAAQATTAITSTISKVSDLVRKLIKTIGNVTPKIRKIVDKLGEIIEKLSKLGKKFARRADGATTPSAAHHIDSPDVHAPDTPHTPDAPDSPDLPDGTTPSGTHSGDGTPAGSDGSVKNSVDDTKTDSREGECLPGSGDPVDLATGQMFTTQLDVELPGMLPLIVKRTHFSSYRAGRFFGRSWASTVDQRIEVEGDGVYFADDGGVRLIYPMPAPGGEPVFAVDGPRWELSLVDGEFRIRQPENGRTLSFLAGDGHVHPLGSIVNRSGHWIDFDYDANLAPTEIRHSGGYRIKVETSGRQVTKLSMAGPGGDLDLIAYHYDESGNLTEIVNSSNRPMRFDYDLAGRITRWQDSNGEWYRYHFDDRGRCVRAEGSGGALAGTWDYDEEYPITRYTNSLGETTEYHLNERNQIVRRIDPLGAVTTQEWDRFDHRLAITDPLGRTTRHTYDDEGHLVTITRPDGSQALAEYNELGLPVAVVEPDGSGWRYSYDEQGNLTSVTDPAGATTRYDYDGTGGLVAVTDATGAVRRLRNNAAGLPLASVDALGATTSYERDQFGRIVALTDPAGHTHRQAWTIEGNLLSRTLPDGTTARWRHDGEGNQIEYTDPLGRVSTTSTTHFDLPADEIAPDGSRLEFGYDTELRLVSVTNQQGRVWRYHYDAAGNLVSETDFNDRTVRYAYDAAGQLVARTNAAGQTTRFVRDPLGNIVERYSGESVATFEYDPIGRLRRARNADAELVYQRDALGRVLAETVNGHTVASGYDTLGRRVYRRTPTGAESRWRYDGAGRPVALETAGRTVTFGYDSSGREIERLLDTGTILAQAWDANSRLTEQTVSTVARTRQPRLIQRRGYHYRADGLLDAVEDRIQGARRFELDEAGRVTAVTGSGWTEQYTYDASGQLAAARAPGDATEQGPREFDGTLVRRAGNVHYQHDAQGRVVLRQKRRLSAKPDTWHYTWDADDRLVAVVTPDGSRWAYRYDPLGRRIAKQRLTPDGTRVAEQVNFHWDAVVIAEQVTLGGNALTWDWEPDSFRVIGQTERTSARHAPQDWVDRQFYSIITDLVGTPTELVDQAGNLAWHADRTLWGQALASLNATTSTPLRFPGQYFDPETQLHYNYSRYYDPASGGYASADPLGLGGGFNPHSYVPNPQFWIDPFGLAKRKKCEGETDAVETMSGWQGKKPDPPNITRADPQDVLDLQQEIGHPAKRAGAMDQGVPGKYFASHAERQAAVLDPGAPIRINLPMCPDCQDFFKALAAHRQQTQIVTEPGGITRTFHPDGSMTVD